MKFPQNLHTHTVFSDGKNTPEEMVRGAVRAGCASLGFSEHSPLPPAADLGGWSMKASDTVAYRREILRLREACGGEISIFLGLEQDADSPVLPGDWDYRIGSVHGLWAEGAYLPVDASPEEFDWVVREHFGGDPYAFAQAYYRREADVVRETRCQVIGHFDLITKFNEGGRRFDETAPRYRRAALETLEALMEHDAIFEINTGAMFHGARSAPYPAPFLLKAICQKGGRVCITSDAHSAPAVVHAFPQAAELAEGCGFREVWALDEGGFRSVDVRTYTGRA